MNLFTYIIINCYRTVVIKHVVPLRYPRRTIASSFAPPSVELLILLVVRVDPVVVSVVYFKILRGTIHVLYTYLYISRIK